jgi:hypothetical protein
MAALGLLASSSIQQKKSSPHHPTAVEMRKYLPSQYLHTFQGISNLNAAFFSSPSVET